jgi:hypothetical protein
METERTDEENWREKREKGGKNTDEIRERKYREQSKQYKRKEAEITVLEQW